MKKCFIYVIAAISALVVSCNKEVDTLEQIPAEVDQNLVPMTFKAALEGDNTKTTLDISDGTVAWAAGDAVKFVWEVNGTSGVGSSVSTALTAGDIDGDGAASFNASVPETFSKATDASVTSRHLYAVYPSDVVVDYSTASYFYLTVPTEQDGTFAKASIAVAKWDKANVNADLVFNNLCGLLQIVIDDANVRKIVLHSDDYIAGKVNYSVNNMKPVAADSSPSNDLKKDITIKVNGAGTFYVAVLPTCEDPKIGVTNMYVELLDENDDLIGDKGTTNPLVIARRQIRKLGTIATGGLENRVYVTNDGAGTKDGSSWDNAMPFYGASGSFRSLILNTDGVTKDIYIREGTYSFNQLSSPRTSTFRIYGGYPSSSTSGKSLKGRVLGSTILDGGNKNRMLVMTKGNWTLDGITFQNAKDASAGTGSALVFENSNGDLVVNNCYFLNNTNVSSSHGGGAVRINCSGHKATFNHCEFYGNSATGSLGGGAMYVGSAGTVSLNDCIFGSSDNPNTATNNGGAVASFGKPTFTRCDFVCNTVTSASSKGGAVSVGGKTAVFIECKFVDNKATVAGGEGGALHVTSDTGIIYGEKNYFTYTVSNGGGASTENPNSAIKVDENAFLGLNNTTVAGPWGINYFNIVKNEGTAVLSNSTIFGQVTLPNINNAGTMTIVNCILPNAGGSGNNAAITNSGSMVLDHTLYSSRTGTGTFIETDCKSGIKTTKSANSPNFPNPEDTYWYVGSTSDMNADNQTSPENSSVRIRYYEWNGMVDGITFGTLETIGEKVKTANAAFKTWLGDKLGVDIRGASRTSTAMWPGSYEGSVTKANIQGFTVK